MDDIRKSILQMCNGAFQERADYEITRIIDNIMDANTKATEKRKLVLTLELIPDDGRQNVSVKCTAKSTLAATNPVTTMLFVADTDHVVEMTPQVPGQTDMYGEVQEAPATLRLVKFG